ncbi:NtaA/DmoA family FMN-dependent monooxygenase [Nakamurella leprariae]|uniref:NtaA/DmoA family FMN-dependent monooxygenase n=1 Tax=Nakamurella leprariae TaxID=2803911 RepID=A0A939C1P2_9ACTN|nr:NtaA/DmoA family FMN-dependent monooxygenase [Nakamurella leprariae]MBM9467364.1 NtaA/DmoA family FMN-dependent monooxygenase [Nakamurella leprariae]
MSDARFHLAWFLNFSSPAWNGTFTGSDGATWTDGRVHVEMARSLERGGFDYLMLEDSSMVSDGYEGSSRVDLKYGLYAPKHDPMPLIPLMADATRHIGIVGTASTTFYPPYLLARRMSTLDHLTGGRVGWNIVTSSEDRAAQNFGMDTLFEHDHRYDRADEYVDLVTRLWESWEPDAVVKDAATGTFVDHTKVHTVDFDGKFFASRGPLNTMPPIQGRPVICQAGGSPRGRQFAATHADTLLASAYGVEKMKAYRDDIRARRADLGGDPDSVKVMFIVSPVLGETMQEAQEKADAMAADSADKVEAALGHLSALTENDFSTFDLDAPVPTVTTNGHRSTLADFLSLGEGNTRTLREIANAWTINSLPLVGTPDHVAGLMGEAMQEVGGDGFLITGKPNRRYISEIADGLCPELRRRGLIRDGYEHRTFRENLMAF